MNIPTSKIVVSKKQCFIEHGEQQLLQTSCETGFCCSVKENPFRWKMDEDGLISHLIYIYNIIYYLAHPPQGFIPPALVAPAVRSRSFSSGPPTARHRARRTPTARTCCGAQALPARPRPVSLWDETHKCIGIRRPLKDFGEYQQTHWLLGPIGTWDLRQEVERTVKRLRSMQCLGIEQQHPKRQSKNQLL